MAHGIVIRDPLWDTIRVDPVATRIVDSPAFQRLRYIKQLGHAHLVYPGATHTRFDHALGVYHLARRALASLRERGGLSRLTHDPEIIPLAGLLHDIGHYPFSHALEELDPDLIPGHHEALVGAFLSSPEVSNALAEVAADAGTQVESLIRGRSAHPLQGLVSGSLDLDKIEYLKRDARFCGVPYGEVDVDRLIYALALVEDPKSGRLEVGVHEKGVASLESLLFAKYQMYRNVYWHHAVRAATVMYKRMVAEALETRLITNEELIGQTDEGLLFLLEARAREWQDTAAGARGSGRAASARLRSDPESQPRRAGRIVRWTEDLRERRLPKRAGEVVAADLEPTVANWLERESPLKRAIEDRIAQELDLGEGAAFLDYPEKPAMFGLDLLVQRRGGSVLRLGPGGRPGLIDLPLVAGELYRTARVLRLFTHGGRREVRPEALARLATMPAEAVKARLEGHKRIVQS